MPEDPTPTSPLLLHSPLKPLETFERAESSEHEVETETPLPKPKHSTAAPLKLIIIATCICMGGSFHFGFQLVITNPTQPIFIEFVNKCHTAHYGQKLDASALDTIWSTIVALLFVGALLGSFVLRATAEKLGRKNGLYLSFVLGQVAIGMAITSAWIFSYELYVVSRILLGCSITMSLGLGAIYLSEVSPKQCRGKIGLVTGSMIQVGTVVGSVIAMPNFFGTKDSWPMIYVVEFGLMFFSFCVLPFLPESPSLLLHRNDEKAARHSVEFFHCIASSEAIKVVEELKEDAHKASKPMGMLSVMRIHKLRRRICVGMVVAFSMAFSGIAVLNGYAVEILRQTGLTQMQASIANVGFTVISLFAIGIASKLIEASGRRSLLIASNLCIVLTNVAIAGLMFLFDKTQWQAVGYLLIIAVGVFTLFFAVGPGPLCHFIAAELLPHRARSAAQGWTTAIQMGSRSFLLLVYLPLKNVTSNAFAYGLLFIIPVFLSTLFLYYELPETKNRTPAQVDEEVHKLPPLCGRVPEEDDAGKPEAQELVL